jgi:uridine kinase
VVDHLLKVRSTTPVERSVLAAVSGIDGSGKGYVSKQLGEALRAQGVRAVVINIDGWLNLPDRRFAPSNPAEHFYLHALRFDEMFSQLVLPLRDRRSLRVVTDHAEETETQYRPQVYEFEDVDVIVLEGIYLLKRAFQAYYDLSVWIECSFETALERALARGQEGLPPEDTIRAYRTIYFPAQEIHFQRDDPKSAATLTFNNDARRRESDLIQTLTDSV